jgi:hypothetical protein
VATAVALTTTPLMSSVFYRIAGFLFELRCEGAFNALRLKPSFRAFEVSEPGVPDGVYRVGWERDLPFPECGEMERAVDAENWRAGTLCNGRYFMDVSYQPNHFWQRAGHFARDLSEGVLYPKLFREGEPAPYTLFFPVDEQVFLHRMALLGGALIHSCGVEYHGQAILFCGRSGIGKSTSGTLWQEAGHALLNDDRMVVRMLQGRAMAGATPWHGTNPSVAAHTVPLAGIFHLVQATENRVERLSEKAGFLALMANVIAPFHDRRAMASIGDAVGEIAMQVPSWRLHFRPHQDAVALVQETLA